MDKFLCTSNKVNAASSSDSALCAEESADASSSSNRKRKGNSDVWKHFEKCKNKMFAKCRLCGKEYKTSGNTSNLSDHLRRIHPLYNTAEDVPTMAKFMKRSDAYAPTSYKKHMLDALISEMVAEDVLPFSFVEGLGFRNLMHGVD